MPSEFVFKDAKFVLLTYSQITYNDELITSILELICDLGGECIIARELHSDGGVHLHVLCEFERKFSTRDARKFDVGGFHPNIKKVKAGTEATVWDYVTKDGDVVGGGLEPITVEGRRGNPTKQWEGEYTSKWAYIVDAADKDEFYNRLRAEDPRALACNYPSIAKYADFRYRKDAEEYSHPIDWTFNVAGNRELTEWLDTYLCDDCAFDR